MTKVYNFHRDLGHLLQVIDRSFDSEESGVEHRKALGEALADFAPSARRYCDLIRSYPPPENPGILFDGYEGEWEELAWVPVAMASTPREAKRAISKKTRRLVLEAGQYLYCDPDSRCCLAPAERHDGEWRYVPCEASAPGAVEFFRIEIAERRYSLRRSASRFRWTLKVYKRMRRNGHARWKSSEAFRIYFSPLHYFRVRFFRRRGPS